MSIQVQVDSSLMNISFASHKLSVYVYRVGHVNLSTSKCPAYNGVWLKQERNITDFKNSTPSAAKTTRQMIGVGRVRSLVL